MASNASDSLPNNVPSKQRTVTFNVGDDYQLLKTIGTGAYGIVCSAIQKATGQHVAIKKIANPFEILTTAKRTLRELKLLLHFKHDNIVGVKNILHCVGGVPRVQDVYVVMDLMESDLHHVIRSQQSLTEDHICYFVYQLLRGLKYIHSANVIHRDLKPSNLLVNENCELKIGDFGMARGVANSPEDHRNFMTEYVATRWYRAPELMLSMSEYSMAIDMWSVGCIFAEMVARKQLFPGRHYVHQLQLIISVLGSPSTKLVKSIRSERVKSYVRSLPHKNAVSLKTLFPKSSDLVVDLLSRFLQFNPAARESAEGALDHPFFKEYHDQDDEPNCPRPFDFRFEMAGQDESGPTKESIKSQVVELIDGYHSKRNRIKKQLIFLPKSPNTSQPPKIDQEAPPSTDQPSVKCQDVTQSEDVFKRPTSLPPAPKFILNKNKMKNQASQDGGENIEMMSAKSETSGLNISSVNLPTSSANDVLMLSASSVSSVASVPAEGEQVKEHENIVTTPEKVPAAPQGKQEANKNSNVKKTISETTRMLVRDTILASMLSKKNGLTKPPEKPKKPVTAAERQREREEKRRKRQEKAAEKERKKREMEGAKPALSDQDKSLLERWSKMQQQAKSKDNLEKPTFSIKNTEQQNAKQCTPTSSLLSPTSLTRQNSLPIMASPRTRTYSNPELAPTCRRWSMNNELMQAANATDLNVTSYIPSLSDIPPSPMIQSSQHPNPVLPKENSTKLVVNHLDGSQYNSMNSQVNVPNLGVADENGVPFANAVENTRPHALNKDIVGSTKSMKAGFSISRSLLQHQSKTDPPKLAGGTSYPVGGGKGQYGGTENTSVSDINAGRSVREGVNAQTGAMTQPLPRPSTLNTAGCRPGPDDGMKIMSGLSTTLSSGTLITSSKSLVTLSPDTVDFVLNQELQRSEAASISTNPPAVPSGPDGGVRASGDVFTLSPGETTIVLKSAQTSGPVSFNQQQKSASIEFSPSSFLIELDKNRNPQPPSMTPSYRQCLIAGSSSTFLQDKNRSVMLPEESLCSKGDIAYADTIEVPDIAKQQQYVLHHENVPFLNKGMVGGYGIGYEPDLEEAIPDKANFRIAANTLRQSYEMDCDSAKSSSSLLNDWLDVSQMEEQDIEQLQRELELGSPMCIDDCNFKDH